MIAGVRCTILEPPKKLMKFIDLQGGSAFINIGAAELKFNQSISSVT